MVAVYVIVSTIVSAVFTMIAKSIQIALPANTFWPIFLAFALVLLASVFRYGERLRKRTEELQHETDRLI